MDFTQRDLMNLANRDLILGNTTVDEQVEFILDQIKQPFDSGSTNYFKKLKRMVTNQDQMDQICTKLFAEVENVYPNMMIDVSNTEEHYAQYFGPVYKFFVKNIKKLMYVFLREYIFNNKNRKGLIMDFMSTKISSYPKEQYGKKEFYILITKLSSIVRSIADDDIRLEKFIDYIDRSDDALLYLDEIRSMLDKGIIYDHGIVADMFDLLDQSDARPGIMNKLEMTITKTLIMPYLEENGLVELRRSGITDPEPEEEDVEDDLEDDEETEEGEE